MRRDHQLATIGQRKQSAAEFLNCGRLSGQASGRCGPQSNDQSGSDQTSFDVIPPPALFDLVIIGTFVQTAFAPDLEFEMFDRIGDENGTPVETRIANCLVQDATRGTHKRMTGEVFIISGLFTDHHQFRRLRSFARHDLGGIPVQRTASALRLGAAES